MDKEIIGIVKETPQILGSIYQDLAQPSVRKVGIALETVFEFSTSFLLPVKLLNEKFKLNFEKRLNEYKEKLNDIPEEKLIEVNPQIGTPILEKLSYTTNDEISELFTNLLTKASSSDTVNSAHPSFVQLIERLSVDEARIIKYLNHKEDIPCISIRGYVKNGEGFVEIVNNATLLEYEVKLMFSTNIKTYLDNLVSMGILNISHGLHLIHSTAYDKLSNIFNYNNMKATLDNSPFKKIDLNKSYYEITDFGKAFIKACNKL